MGRPSDYTQELAQRLCAEIAQGKSLRTVCAPDGMPSIQTVYNWIHNIPGFLEQYAHAKDDSADALIEDMVDIADDGTNDFMTITKGDLTYEVENKEVTNRSRLRVDTRKWIASKLKPKKYGDKLDLTSDGKELNSLNKEQTIAAILEIQKRATKQ